MMRRRDRTSEGLAIVQDASRRNFLKRLVAGAGVVGVGGLDVVLGSEWNPAGRQSQQTYTNPVYAGSMPDPLVLQHRGTYYGFGTTGGERKPDGRIFSVLRSTNLVDWQELGGALTPPTPDAAYQYWAPEVAYDNGTFYLYYAMGGKEEEKFALRVATSSTPQGPYTDNGMPLLDCEHNRFTIDAHPFKDVDGQWYMFYARNFLDTEGGVFPGTAVVVDRLVDMTKLAGQCRTVVRARHPWTLYEARRRMNVYNRTFDEWHTIEGAFVRRHDGRYYCFYSGSNYQTAIVRGRLRRCRPRDGTVHGQGSEARVLKRRTRQGARARAPLDRHRRPTAHRSTSCITRGMPR